MVIPIVAKVKSKPPAVMVKVKQGKTYADTVMAVRKFSGVNVESLGATIKGIRRTTNGHVLLEFDKGAKAEEASKKVRGSCSLGSQNRLVTFPLKELYIEVIDIDAGADREEVEQGLTKTIDELYLGVVERVKITGLWPTRSGIQVATARMSRMMADKLTRVAIGWTMCRVRPRMRALIRCYRCHGFGHTTGACTGPNLTGSCRRCGLREHKEEDCERIPAKHAAGLDKEVKPHKPGNISCLATRGDEEGVSTKII